MIKIHKICKYHLVQPTYYSQTPYLETCQNLSYTTNNTHVIPYDTFKSLSQPRSNNSKLQVYDNSPSKVSTLKNHSIKPCTLQQDSNSSSFIKYSIINF